MVARDIGMTLCGYTPSQCRGLVNLPRRRDLRAPSPSRNCMTRTEGRECATRTTPGATASPYHRHTVPSVHHVSTTHMIFTTVSISAAQLDFCSCIFRGEDGQYLHRPLSYARKIIRLQHAGQDRGEVVRRDDGSARVAVPLCCGQGC